jgi:hypothetical protein
MAYGYEQVGGFYEAGVSYMPHKVWYAMISMLILSPDRVEGLAEMTAVGLGLPTSSFKDAGTYG